MVADLEGGRWCGNSQGAMSGEGISGSGSAQRQRGYFRLRESQIVAFAVDISGALMKWPLWSLDFKNSWLQADGLDHEVYLRAPCEWNSEGTRRVWKLRTPAYGLDAARVPSHRPFRKYLASLAESLPSVGLRFEVSSFGPCLFFIFRKSGVAVGAVTRHVDDMLLYARRFSGERFGEFEVQERSFAHVGAEVAQEKGFPVTLTPEELSKNLKPLPSSPGRWTYRKSPLSRGDTKFRQLEMGELCWVATVS